MDWANHDSLTGALNRRGIEDVVKSSDLQSAALMIVDIDHFKHINDAHGHSVGDRVLARVTSTLKSLFRADDLICRMGGDEFAVILQGHDYENRAALEKTFFEKSAEISTFAKEPWERISVSAGIAEYDPSVDRTVEDVFNRADHLMYENKRERKPGRDPE